MRSTSVLPMYARSRAFTGTVHIEVHAGQPVVVIREVRVDGGRMMTQFGAVDRGPDNRYGEAQYSMPCFPEAIDAADAAAMAKVEGCITDITIIQNVTANFGYPRPAVSSQTP